MSDVHHKRVRPMKAVAVAKESALPAPPAARSLPESCPLREPAAMAAFRAAVKSGSELSLHSQRFLAAKTPKEVGAWFGALMEHSRTVFQPWSMELLFVAGVLGEVRFSQLEQILGASSRTLSNKLRALVAAGLLERRVEGGPPVRISYRLTKTGRATVAVSSPLFAHLNLMALGLA
jgi:DNA-binding HxlR family transcriptional regulator